MPTARYWRIASEALQFVIVPANSDPTSDVAWSRRFRHFTHPQTRRPSPSTAPGLSADEAVHHAGYLWHRGGGIGGGDGAAGGLTEAPNLDSRHTAFAEIVFHHTPRWSRE